MKTKKDFGLTIMMLGFVATAWLFNIILDNVDWIRYVWNDVPDWLSFIIAGYIGAWGCRMGLIIVNKLMGIYWKIKKFFKKEEDKEVLTIEEKVAI